MVNCIDSKTYLVQSYESIPSLLDPRK